MKPGKDRMALGGGRADCLVPSQADANEPHQPLTSLPEKQASNVMRCHCSLWKQLSGEGVSISTDWPVGAD